MTNTPESPETPTTEVAVAVFATHHEALRFAQQWTPELEVLEEFHGRTVFLVWYPVEALPFEEVSR